MPNPDLENLNASLFRLFGKIGGSRSNKLFLLMPLWREAAGPVAENTSLRGLSGGVLHVVTDPTFAAVLRQSHDVLLERMNRRLDPYHQLKAIRIDDDKSLERGQEVLPFVHQMRPSKR